jgi:hypothetical protein
MRLSAKGGEGVRSSFLTDLMKGGNVGADSDLRFQSKSIIIDLRKRIILIKQEQILR